MRKKVTWNFWNICLSEKQSCTFGWQRIYIRKFITICGTGKQQPDVQCPEEMPAEKQTEFALPGRYWEGGCGTGIGGIKNGRNIKGSSVRHCAGNHGVASHQQYRTHDSAE